MLELGAGTGRDSRYFQDQGFEVVSIDLSPAMIELCRQKSLTAYVMDMGNIDFPENSFDAVYSMNSFYTSPKQKSGQHSATIVRGTISQAGDRVGKWALFSKEGLRNILLIKPSQIVYG